MEPQTAKADRATSPSASDLEQAFEAFRAAHPGFSETRDLDELRAAEFSRLDQNDHVYLDYTGGGLYGDCQVKEHCDFLLQHVLGNPHSTNPTSQATTDRIERCRQRVLDFFRASPDEYAVIFTANASQALKLVGESYPFEPGDQFLLTFDNHNSVNGIREFDRAHGAETTYIPLEPPELRIGKAVLDQHLDRARPGRHNLFAYPAQSNFSGVQHSLEWIDRAQRKGWDVLLDAAAFVPTNRLDLSLYKPDYVALSFYKMFGYPTGVGALIARWRALEKLHRPWFAGGTIEVASVKADQHVLAGGAAAFEDGTLDYSNIPAVEIGLDFLDKIGVERIHDRVQCLAKWLINELVGLRYDNGVPLILLYGPACVDARGGAIAANFQDRNGQVIDHQVIEDSANRHNISLRTGCFCNPGAGEIALGLARTELVTCFSQSSEEPNQRLTLDDFRRCIDSKSTGAVRISLGIASNFRDVHSFVAFAKTFLS